MTCDKCGCDLPFELADIPGPVRCSCGRWLGVARFGVPAWARAIAAWWQPGEEGVGDTFHRLAAKVGAEFVISWLNIDCGCEARREDWNNLYRYDERGQII